MSANVVAIILFPNVHYYVKRFTQKRFFGMKDEEIIRLFLLFLEEVTLFPGQCFQYYLYVKYL